MRNKNSSQKNALFIWAVLGIVFLPAKATMAQAPMYEDPFKTQKYERYYSPGAQSVFETPQVQTSQYYDHSFWMYGQEGYGYEDQYGYDDEYYIEQLNPFLKSFMHFFNPPALKEVPFIFCKTISA